MDVVARFGKEVCFLPGAGETDGPMIANRRLGRDQFEGYHGRELVYGSRSGLAVALRATVRSMVEAFGTALSAINTSEQATRVEDHLMGVDIGGRGRPEADEYLPYWGRYTALVPDGAIIEIMDRQVDEIRAYFAGFSTEAAVWRAAPDEWSAIEVAGHLGDAERLLMHRAFRLSRCDETPWENFEPDLYVANGGFGARTPADIVGEWAIIRAGTLALLRGMDDASWARRMPESFSVRSVRAFAYIVAGHVTHHLTALRAERVTRGSEF